MSPAIEKIMHEGEYYSLIVRASFQEPGQHFLTDPKYDQQLAFMKYPAGQEIQSHRHISFRREVFTTQETLIIRKGILRVFFFDLQDQFFAERDLHAGDILLLIQGGHGFHVIEALEMFEVKQGPYYGDQDKVKFTHGPSGKSS
jgi:mannose-6-phosphate isomerase-like protein (cupin superfamily)